MRNDPEWVHWSDREIARRCHVHHQMVATIRKQLTVNVHSEKPGVTADFRCEDRTYTTKHGTVAKMKTDNIGSNPPRTADLPKPVDQQALKHF